MRIFAGECKYYAQPVDVPVYFALKKRLNRTFEDAFGLCYDKKPWIACKNLWFDVKYVWIQEVKPWIMKE